MSVCGACEAQKSEMTIDKEQDDWVENALREAERRKCVRKVLSIEKEAAVGKGDNYCCDITRLKLRVQRKDGQVVDKSLILKSLPVTEYRRNFMKRFGLVSVEIKIYRDVLPMLDVIREEKENDEPLWGECYGIDGCENILFEDLRTKGYKMGERRKGLDFEHCSLVMTSLGKYHALTAVLSQRGELYLDDFDKHWLQSKTESVGQFYTKSLQQFIETMETKWEEEWKPYIAPLKKISTTLLEDLVKSMERDEQKFNVLNHGDCWVNNMLFKYDHSGKPTSLRFLDFQLSFYNSPAFDLQYFLNTSAQLDVRQRFEELVEVYHRSLARNLQLFGYTSEIPSMEEIMDEFQQRHLFGMITAICVLAVILRTAEEVPDMEETMKRYAENEDEYRGHGNENDLYMETMKVVLSIYKEKGFLKL